MDKRSDLAFDGYQLAQRLAAATNHELDQLEFGVVEMNLAGTVLRYNKTESDHSGLLPERVVGRYFFLIIAPCCNNSQVAHRYAGAAVDETVKFTFALRSKHCPVTLRLLKDASAKRMYLLVRW